MNGLNIVIEHEIIRETIGYDGLKDIELHDLPSVLEFLEIVYNYNKMKRIYDKT